MLSTIADLYGILGGIFLTVQIALRVRRSYRAGNIAAWRRRRAIQRTDRRIRKLKSTQLLDEEYPNIDEHIRNWKVKQIREGNEAERIEAINYVRYLGPDKTIDLALKDVICVEEADPPIVIRALEVLSERKSKPI